MSSYNWLVLLNHEGVQAQYLLGRVGDDPEETAREEKELRVRHKNRAKILFVFEEGRAFDDNWRDKNTLKEYEKKLIDKFYTSKGAWEPSGLAGYNIRKTTIQGGPYIEVVSELETSDLSEFHKLDPEDILLGTRRLLHPIKDDPAKVVLKWIDRIKDYEEEGF